MSAINRPAADVPLASETKEARGKIKRFPPGQFHELVNRAAEKAKVEFKLRWTRWGDYRYVVNGKALTLRELISLIDKKLVAAGKKPTGL